MHRRRFAIASNIIINIIVTIITGVATPGSACWLFFRGRRARPLSVAGDQGQTMRTSTHGQWKKEVQEESHGDAAAELVGRAAVSYTHLTLPTNREV
mgnify:CR=1 FL=1